MGTVRLREVKQFVLDHLLWNKEPGISVCFSSSQLVSVDTEWAASAARDCWARGSLHAGLQTAALTRRPTAIHLNHSPSEVLPVFWRDFIIWMSKPGLLLGDSPNSDLRIMTAAPLHAHVPRWTYMKFSQTPASLSLTLFCFAINRSGLGKQTELELEKSACVPWNTNRACFCLGQFSSPGTFLSMSVSD